jgi:hypothetical protein
VATLDKDFKVKNGLNVALGGSFGGTVTVATPTENAHAATKLYVDSISLDPIVEISSTPPTIVNGLMYVDSITNRLNIYVNDEWIEFATLADTFDMKQHIHDTAIDGTGIIVSIFQDGGFYDTQFTSNQDAGYYDFNEWAMTWNGGVAIDNFN